MICCPVESHLCSYIFPKLMAPYLFWSPCFSPVLESCKFFLPLITHSRLSLRTIFWLECVRFFALECQDIGRFPKPGDLTIFGRCPKIAIVDANIATCSTWSKYCHMQFHSKFNFANELLTWLVWCGFCFLMNCNVILLHKKKCYSAHV